MKKFNEYKQLNLPEVSREVLADWEKEDLFHKSIETREGHPQFLFFEGPPSANGMPGIHHVLARTIKDTFCRYKTMQGYQVHRKAGWDTHGLPVELGVEKMLGITKEDIGKKISVDEYNAACRREVMKYTREWTNLTKQMGYWVDLENPYITYDNKYIETLWYLLKRLYENGYLYKGYTIQPYSPAAGTGLSSHELNQPGCYRDVKDTTCTAQFKIKELNKALSDTLRPLFEGDGGSSLYALAWTTTPWTLPSNTALCVGPKIDYVVVRGENPYTKIPALYLLAEARLGAYGKELGETPEVLWRGKGTDLVGIEYEQLIPWARPDGDAFRIIAGDYVTTEDGTGIVHIAPTFGADDAFVAKKAGIAGMVFLTKKGEQRPMVDMTGKFFTLEDLDEAFVAKHIDVEAYKPWAGRFVKNAYDPNLTDKDETLDVSICIALKAENKAFRIEKHVHNYPHCWRTDKPVLYYPLDSWFIRSTKAREEMIRLNDTINWQPESTGTGRFGKWLENLNDWNLSRSRYWGTPLPIWRTEDGKEELCIGSIKELSEEIDKAIKAGFMTENPWPKHIVGDYSKENYDPAVIDLHRPYVDNIILCSPSGKPMKRELDLIDVWFDSGAMPYAQNHYPFENQDAPRTADFISEGVDQTRGWFFTLHAIHTMIEDKVAYKNVISNGLVLDKNGNKMSKRLGNAVDPFATLDKYGADPVRWYMLTNSSPWDNLKFDPEGVDEIRRKFFGTLYNTYGFFALYANVDGWSPATGCAEMQEIDKWVLSRLNSLIQEVTADYEAYEPTKAGRAISDFVQDDLSNWYVRLNRKRFWGGEMNDDKLSAYQTLFTCLKTVALLIAPVSPFFADRLYTDLTAATTGESTSVHLADFPVADESVINKALEEEMKMAQDITSMVLALRRKANLKVRQPLAMIMVPVMSEAQKNSVEAMSALIKNEVNVKEIKFVGNDEGVLVKKVKPDFKKLGPKFGKIMKLLAAQITAMSQHDIIEFEKQGKFAFTVNGEEAVVELSDVEVISEDIPGWLVANEGSLTVALDITVSDELRREGIARELVNRIQNIRKSQGFEITDKIDVVVTPNAATDEAVREYADYIGRQVLAESVTIAEIADADRTPLDMDEYPDLSASVKIHK